MPRRASCRFAHKAMTKKRIRGRPSNEYYDKLSKAKGKDMARLAQACIEAIIRGEKDIMVSFSYVFEFPEGFPKGIREERTEQTNVHRIKTFKLLNWLYDNGYTPISVKMVRYSKQGFTKQYNELTKIFDDIIDEDQDIVDNALHQLNDEEEE